MKAIKNTAVSFTITVELSEEEARALAVLPSYGADSFLEFFYEKLGRTCLEPHENGIKELFETIKSLYSELASIDRVRGFIQEEKNPRKANEYVEA